MDYAEKARRMFQSIGVPYREKAEPLFKVGDLVVTIKLMDEFTSRKLIGVRGIISEVDILPNNYVNYTVRAMDGDHYMHEEELQKVDPDGQPV